MHQVARSWTLCTALCHKELTLRYQNTGNNTMPMNTGRPAKVNTRLNMRSTTTWGKQQYIA